MNNNSRHNVNNPIVTPGTEAIKFENQRLLAAAQQSGKLQIVHVGAPLSYKFSVGAPVKINFGAFKGLEARIDKQVISSVTGTDRPSYRVQITSDLSRFRSAADAKVPVFTHYDETQLEVAPIVQKLALKAFKHGAQLDAPIYVHKPYVVLSSEDVVLWSGTKAEALVLSEYYNGCEVDIRRHDLHLNDNTKVAQKKVCCFLTAILNRDIPLTDANIKIARAQLAALNRVESAARPLVSKHKGGRYAGELQAEKDALNVALSDVVNSRVAK